MSNPVTDPVVPAKVRDFLYPILLAALPLLAAWGVIAETDIPLYAALGAALLGVVTATAYRPSKTIPDGTGRYRAEPTE